MRAFIALELPDELRFQVKDLACQLQGQVKGRFLPPQNYHVTLAFLGDVSQFHVIASIEALEAACAQAGPVCLASNELGRFGKARDATLWLGFKQSDKLAALAQAVRDQLAVRGVPFDDKPFKAHVTLARRAHVPSVCLSALPFPHHAEARVVTLFKSELSSEGATYHALHSVELA